MVLSVAIRIYLNLFGGNNHLSLLVLNILLVLHAGRHTHFKIKVLHLSRKIINHVDGLGKELGLHGPLCVLVGGNSLLAIFCGLHMLLDSRCCALVFHFSILL